MLFSETVSLAQHPEEVAARLIGRGDEELARTLTSAAARPQDKSSTLWLLTRSFHLLSHRRQCELVLRSIRGFVALPPPEQAQAVKSVAKRIRSARAGWKEAAERHLASIDNDHEEWLYPFVGTVGRTKADPNMVELLDAMEAALRRLQQGERRRLHRRLDKGVSEGITPRVFARLLAELPEEEVVALEAWLVDEGALTADAARKLFGALTKAAVAGGTVLGVGEQLADDANALWSGLAEDIANTGVEDFWPDWLQGTSSTGSPRDSISQEDSPHRVKVISTAAFAAGNRKTMDGRRSSGGDAGASGECGGSPSSAAGDTARAPRRSSVQLHCPAQAFLWSSDTSASRQQPLQQAARPSVAPGVADFLGPAPSKSEAESQAPPDDSADEGSTVPTVASSITTLPTSAGRGSRMSLGEQFGL